MKTLDSDVVEKIDVGLASNPDNVKRVEFILTEVTKPNQTRFKLVQIIWFRLYLRGLRLHARQYQTGGVHPELVTVQFTYDR